MSLSLLPSYRDAFCVHGWSGGKENQLARITARISRVRSNWTLRKGWSLVHVRCQSSMHFIYIVTQLRNKFPIMQKESNFGMLLFWELPCRCRRVRKIAVPGETKRLEKAVEQPRNPPIFPRNNPASSSSSILTYSSNFSTISTQI